MTITIRQRGANKTWAAQVIRTIRGERITRCATFPTKPEARQWAALEEAKLYAMKTGRAAPGATFADLCGRYLKEMDAHGELKTGHRQAFKQYGGDLEKGTRPDPLMLAQLNRLDQTDFINFRDRETKRGLKTGSVRRVMSIWSAVCTRAVDEWKLLPLNPMLGMRFAIGEEAERNRRPTAPEIQACKVASGYRPDVKPESKQARIMAAFLFACETGMRLGEICGIAPADCHVKAGWVQVAGVAPRANKTKSTKRQVPLTDEAKRILQQMLDADFPGYVFGLKASPASTAWQAITAKAKVANLHFHDSRHEAISRLARTYEALALAKFVGISDLRTLLGVYYNPSIDELVAKMPRAA